MEQQSIHVAPRSSCQHFTTPLWPSRNNQRNNRRPSYRIIAQHLHAHSLCYLHVHFYTVIYPLPSAKEHFVSHYCNRQLYIRLSVAGGGVISAYLELRAPNTHINPDHQSHTYVCIYRSSLSHSHFCTLKDGQ